MDVWIDANDYLIGLIEGEIDRKFVEWKSRQKTTENLHLLKGMRDKRIALDKLR